MFITKFDAKGSNISPTLADIITKLPCFPDMAMRDSSMFIAVGKVLANERPKIIVIGHISHATSMTRIHKIDNGIHTPKFKSCCLSDEI